LGTAHPAATDLGGLIGTQGIGPPVLVVFEGWDASGKGGSIKRLVAPLDPRHVRVVQFAAPTPTRSATTSSGASGRWGGMAVFDRSWYGRVLVERVDGLATREQWLRAYDEINAFERSLADEGTIIVKLWLHISEEERLKALRAARSLAHDCGRVEAIRPGRGRPHHDRGDRNRHAGLGPGAARHTLALCRRTTQPQEADRREPIPHLNPLRRAARAGDGVRRLRWGWQQRSADGPRRSDAAGD
jgi:hypothetical protein